MTSSISIQVGILMVVVLSCGMSSSFPAVVLPAFAMKKIELSSTEVSVVGSIRQLGIVVGSFSIGPLLDNWGRRRGTLSSIVPAIAGYAVISIYDSVFGLSVGLLASGIAMGMINISSSVFLAEVLSEKWRRIMSVGRTVFVSFGLTITYILALFIKDNIQVISLIALVMPSVAFLSGLVLIKETSVWVEDSTSKNRHSKSFGGAYVQFWKALRTRPEVYKPFLILNFLNFLRHCTGGGVITNYAITIVTDTGATTDPYIIAVALGAFRTGGSLLGAVLSSFFKRQIILVISGVLMTISMVGISFINLIDDYIVFAPEIFLNIFMTTSTIFLAVSMSLQGEVYPTEFRGMCSSTSMMISNLQAAVVLFTYPILTSALGSRPVMMLYAVSCAGCVLVSYFMVPNTDNKTLEEIGQMFQQKEKENDAEGNEEILPLQPERSAPVIVKTEMNQKDLSLLPRETPLEPL